MEASDPFARAGAAVDDPFGGASLEEMAEQEPEGFGQSPESELAGEPAPATNEEPPSSIPVVDREGQPVEYGEEEIREALAESGYDGPPAGPDDDLPPSHPAAIERDLAAAAAEPAPAPEAAPAPEPQAAPSQAESPAPAPEAAVAVPAAPEAAPADDAPSPQPAPAAAVSQPRRGQRTAAKKADEGPRLYRPLFMTAKHGWTELPLNNDSAKEVKDHIRADEDGVLWIEANNVDQARRLAYAAAGRPRDGIRLVLVAEKSWQPKTIKPKVVPAREALEIS